jgi:hypothetical protein
MRGWVSKLLFLFLIGCSQRDLQWEIPKVKGVKMENQNVTISDDQKMKEKEPLLNFSLTKEGKLLRIRYELINELSRNIYIFNVMWDVNQDGKEVLAEKQVYISLINDSLISFSKRIPPLPVIRTVEFRYLPYATRIEPGKKFEEELILHIPVEEYNPYFPNEESSETETKIAESCVFSIDYIFEVENLEIKETEIKNAFSIWHPKLMQSVKTLKSKVIPAHIEVIYRKDEFERF